MLRLIKMIQRDFMNLLLNPTWMLFCVLFPFLLISIMGFMTKEIYGDMISGYDYYGVTFMIYSALFATSFSANSFMEERIKKANLRVMYATTKSWEIPTSKTIATFLYTVSFYTVVAIIIRFLFNINYGTSFLELWLLFASLDLLCSAIGVFMCCILRSESTANQILSLVTNVFALFAGLLFPLSTLGSTMSKIGEWNPLSKVTSAAFQIIYDDNTKQVLPLLISMGLIVLVLMILSHICFKEEDYL